MPKMGESLQEGTITKWLKKEGDAVDRDEMILEISTDKVDTEVPAPQSGVLAKILVAEGDTVEVGSVIAELETDASIADQAKTTTDTVKGDIQVSEKENALEVATGKLIEVVMPKMGESLQEGTITKWLKSIGDKVERDEMILEISTDKVDTEVPSPVEGVLAEFLAAEGDTVEVGSVIAKISSGGQVHVAEVVNGTTGSASQAGKVSAVAQVTITDAPKSIPRKANGKFYSPLVRSIAEAEGLTLNELNSLSGSGSDGRVTKTDLLAYLENRSTKQVAPVSSQRPVSKPTEKLPATPKRPEPVPVSAGDEDEIIPMDRVRQLISEHMVYSKQTSPHVTSVAEADVTDIVRFRNKYKDSFMSEEGFKLTFTPFFAQAAIDGIRQFPMVNVSVDGKNIIRHKRVHLSFATALEDGNLIVPVIKNADSMNFTGLARSVYDLSTRARSKKLNPEDIQGGTFTITNVGTFGTLFGTPIINQPQAAIMGIGAIKKRPVVKEFNGEHLIVVRDMAYVSITYDHRVIDGMLAGQTLAHIVKSLESMNEETIKY
jgi:2-oxoglutarate dehydrogenase E2 component (dihydrolipoamide succinyltransferase)